MEIKINGREKWINKRSKGADNMLVLMMISALRLMMMIDILLF